MKYLLLALSLSACGLVDDLDKALDNEEPAPGKAITIRRCAGDSAQAADTANFARCEVRPPSSTP